jgi:hypothetical protein
MQFVQTANCLLDAVFTSFYFFSLATASNPVAAKVLIPNNQCVLVVFTQFVCRIHSKMNSKLTKEYGVFLLQSLWKRSDKPEVITAVVSKSSTTNQTSHPSTQSKIRRNSSGANLHIIRGQTKIG